MPIASPEPEVTGKHGVPVFEDDCYADLRFEGEDVASFHSLDDTGRVVYVGSFSKIIVFTLERRRPRLHPARQI